MEVDYLAREKILRENNIMVSLVNTTRTTTSLRGILNLIRQLRKNKIVLKIIATANQI